MTTKHIIEITRNPQLSLSPVSYSEVKDIEIKVAAGKIMTGTMMSNTIFVTQSVHLINVRLIEYEYN